MLKHAAKRILLSFLVLLGVIMITFAITRLLPSDPALKWAGPKATPEQIEAARIELGLDRPIYVQFWNYLTDLVHPLAYRLGSVYVYNDAGFYLLGRAIHALSGETMDQFLMKRLTAPLHFSEVAWSLCPHGHPIAGTGLYVQAKDMVKLAWLYQNGGVYEGRRILSEEWVNQVIDRQYELAPLREGSQWIGKAGLNGQMICFSAQKRIAVAWHSYEPNQGDKLFIDYLHEISE